MLNPFKASSSLDEVVFANRNKAYGAYAIRKQYDLNVTKALAIVFASFILLSLSGFLIDKPLPTTKTIVPEEVVKVIEIDLTKMILPPAGPATPETPAAQTPPPATSSNNNNYTVQADNRVTTDVPVTNPETPTLTNVQPGTAGTGTASTTVNTGGGGPLGTAEIPATEPWIATEIMPVFNNGVGDIGAYLAREIIYPKQALLAGIEGKVVVKFDIAPDGSIVNVKVLKGIGFGCDEEAVRVVSNMPRWKPGIQNGKAVPVRMTLPIKFQIQ